MIQKIRIIANNSAEYTGLSTDLVDGKPPVIKNCGPGSTLYICDTKAGWYFDGTTWWPV
jgi:hypothetical protein